MKEPTGPELAQLLRESFPEMNAAGFDENVAFFCDDTPSQCGVLLAFSWQFNEWVGAGDAELVRRALDLIDYLLAESPEMPTGKNAAAVGEFHNSLLACFVESVMDTTPAFRFVVLPNLGPVVREHLRKYDPSWLVTDTLASN